MHKNNFGENIPDTHCNGWRYISKENADRIAELYVNEIMRDDGDFELDFKIIKEAIRLKEADRVYRTELWDEQYGWGCQSEDD
jgi:hypothetical protein